MNKVFIVLALVFAVSCADGPLFDVYQFLDQEVNGEGVPITTEICMEETKFKILKTAINPSEIIKGQDINIKVQGQALVDLTMKNLNLVTKYNGADIFTDNKDQGGKAVPTGDKFQYQYTASVPTFTPAGEWDIYLKLENDDDEVVSCLKAHFTMP